jgi:inorganic pyrophosphatase
MNQFDKLTPGRDVPNDINVVIEIPTQSHPVKYEVDKETGTMSVDRFMSTAMYYPCNYGYVPQTLSEDGDPVDVLVITPFPLITGSVIRCRPLGLLKMEDESGIDGKILAVPIDKLTHMYANIKTLKDLPEAMLATIAHFFEHYKDLEKGKWVKVKGWEDFAAVKEELESSIKRYKAHKAGK